jgi:hypothetical protein
MLPKARGPGFASPDESASLRSGPPAARQINRTGEIVYSRVRLPGGDISGPRGGAGSSRRQNAHHVRKFHSAPAASGSVGGLKKELTMPGRGREHEVRRLIRDLEALATTNEPTGN